MITVVFFLVLLVVVFFKDGTRSAMFYALFIFPLVTYEFFSIRKEMRKSALKAAEEAKQRAENIERWTGPGF